MSDFMDDFFAKLFSNQAKEIINGDFYYDADHEGDQFDETDEAHWLNGGFKRNWDYHNQSQSWRKDIFELYDGITTKIACDGKPFMDVACGPGMGLSPMILAKNRKIPCLATDACSRLIKAWRCYINENLTEYNISLASFSVLNMPIKENSLDYMTSNIGISSTRNGESGQLQALKEIFRVLKPGGSFVTVENEWTDMAQIAEVFRLWGKDNYYKQQEMPWRDKFVSAGFKIESESQNYLRKLAKNDNDLGEAADRFGIEIGMKFTLYVLRKS